MDRDTFVSAKSYEVAAKSAGVVISAVDAVMKKKCRGAFCAIRPPGHHVGTWGAVEALEALDITSLGFCLLNNVAIGAAYVMYNYRLAIK
jgi:acetoin utilization deacetylase AcuC-like enzyme